jgi:hypothetical protein
VVAGRSAEVVPEVQVELAFAPAWRVPVQVLPAGSCRQVRGVARAELVAGLAGSASVAARVVLVGSVSVVREQAADLVRPAGRALVLVVGRGRPAELPVPVLLAAAVRPVPAAAAPE